MIASETGSGAPRRLDISDLERVERFRTAGYGGSVSDSLAAVGIRDTVLSPSFRPLVANSVMAGRAVTVKIHSQVGGMEAAVEQDGAADVAEANSAEADLEDHPQRLMMKAIDDAEDGTILCFDCGGDSQPAHFGEMSCQLAQAHGCRGLLLAGYCRDTRYVAAMDDFTVFSFGTRPNAFGGWNITEVNKPIFLPGHLTHYVRVNPGDFVFADLDGAQIIPAPVVDEVLLRVEEIFAIENEQREKLAAGMPIDEVYREYGVL